MDTRSLQKFLSQPRTISELAARFGIPVVEAERLVMGAVEAGEVLLSSPRENQPDPAGDDASRPRLIRPITTGTIPTGETRHLPSAQAHAVRSRLGLERYPASPFGMKNSGPVFVRRKQPAVVPSRMQKKPRNNARLSIGEKILLYESLLSGPKTSTDLRSHLEVSRRNLEVLVRNDLVQSSWGPKGVGVLFEITKKGKQELERLKEASQTSHSLAKKTFISTKALPAH